MLTSPSTMPRPRGKDADDDNPRNLGRYRLYGELASGGMATVHLGRQLGQGGFSKMVAIKRLHPQFGKVDEFVEMFLAEARLAARIRHPNVVQPLDVLRVEDEVFLVMEYVEGDSLSRLMKATIARQERVPLPIAVAIVSGVLHGLHAAHEAKNDKGEPLEIVHRDVSPQNVLVGIDGATRVIDFGIAKAADSVQVTREGELKGKLAYIAPEILGGHRGTRRADIYAAAVVLWEVLTAQRLFDADYQSAVLANILHRAVEPPGDFVPDLPPAIDDVVMKGLARDPSDRFATAREMAMALEEASAASSPAKVGQWVEVVAATSLATRGKRVRKIEARSSQEDTDDEPEEVVSELITVSAAEAAVLAAAASPVSARPREARASFPPPPPRSLPTPPQAPPPPAPPPPQRSLTPTVQGSGPVSPLSSAAAAPPPPPTIAVSETRASVAGWQDGATAPSQAVDLPAAAKKRSSGGGIVVFMVLVALGVAVFYIGLPEFLKRGYTAAAAKEGVTLTIDGCEVSFRHVRLTGLTATMADLPGFTAHAGSLDVSFSTSLDPTDATTKDVLVTIDGTRSAVTDSIARARLAHDWKSLRQGPLRMFAVESGHVVWSRAFGEGTRLEAEAVTFETERSGSGDLGSDLSFASPIVGITASWGKVGPWTATGQLDAGKGKLTLAFDPSGASKASATFVTDGASVTSFDLTIPRSNVALLGIPNALLGRRPDDPLFADGEAHFAVRSPSRVESSLHLGLSGARLANAMASADALIDARVDGDPQKPIDLTKGSLSFGPFRGTLAGPVTFGDGFVRAELTFRTSFTSCPGSGDVALGGGIAFDTRALGDSHLVVAPTGRCPLRILPL
jgi:eukaryotic-like serine/threonine-protein kinase